MSAKVAMLIDAENISHRDLPEILEKLTPFGAISLRTIYGDWHQPDMQPWHVAAEQHQILPRQQTRQINVKNTSDMLLIMDAMDILHYRQPDVFCLVSNDADYVALCEKIRESGKTIIGIGYKHAAESLIRACDQFIFVARDDAPTAQSTNATHPTNTTNGYIAAPEPSVFTIMPTESPHLRYLITQALKQAPKNSEAWTSLSQLGQAIRKIEPDFHSTKYGYAKLYLLLQSMLDIVDIRTDNHGQARLKHNPQSPNLRGNGTHNGHQNQVSAQMLSTAQVRKMVIQAINQAPKDKQGWASLSAIGSFLNQNPGYDLKRTGHSNLTKLLQSMPGLITIKTVGSVKYARLKG